MMPNRRDGSLPSDLTAWGAPACLRPVELLGHGGFGKVFLCEDSEGNRFAIKVFEPLENADREKTRQRFVRGAEIMKSTVNDPGVVQVRSIFTGTQGTAAFLMDFIQGTDLERLVLYPDELPTRVRRWLPTDESKRLTLAVRLVRDAAATLSRVHEGRSTTDHTSVVHRDVKPSNILIEATATGLRAVLADFDLAYSRGGNLSAVVGSRSHRVFAATNYMAPEFRDAFSSSETEGDVLRFRSTALDVYGLAATLCFVVTKRPPPSPSFIRRNLAREERRLKRALGTVGARNVKKLIRECLPEELDRTPGDASDFQRTLDEALSPGPIAHRAGRFLARALFGPPMDSSLALAEHYSAGRRRSIGRTATARVALLFVTLAVGLIGWFAGGPPAEITLVTVVVAATIVSSLFLRSQSAEAMRPGFVLDARHHLAHHAQRPASLLSFAYWGWFVFAYEPFEFVPEITYFTGLRGTISLPSAAPPQAGRTDKHTEPLPIAKAIGSYLTCDAGQVFIARTGSRVGPFCMDETEATVGSYRECADAYKCSRDGLRCAGSPTWTDAAGDLEQYPINCITFEQAAKYCRFRNGDLPTREQWLAARETVDTIVSPSTACIAQGNGGRPCRARAFAGSASSSSPIGLVGNLTEWTTTIDPSNSAKREAYGANWRNGPNDGLLSQAAPLYASGRSDSLGARCVRTPTERFGIREHIPRRQWAK